MNPDPESLHGGPPERDGIRRVLLVQYALHEAWHQPESADGGAAPVPTVPKAHTLADIYKCLHQGQFGIGHSIEDPARFSHLLASELLNAGPNLAEPTLEDVSPSGSVLRVNLRPYRQRFSGRDEDGFRLLLEVCLSSAATHIGQGRDFMAALEGFRDLNNSGELVVQGRSYVFPAEMVDGFFGHVNDFVRNTRSIPVLSHSPDYKRYNAPSYRVVDRSILEHSALASLLRETE